MLDAARKMHSAHVVALPVVDSARKLRGMLSQGDVIRLVAQSENLEAMPAESVVAPCSALAPTDEIDLPEQAVMDGLPLAAVVDRGTFLGVVTPADVTAQLHLARLLGERASELITTISPDDDMYFNSRGNYLKSGSDAFVQIHRSIAQVGNGDPKKILDMPSGYGRVLRVLSVAFPHAEITACDIKRDAVDFCAAVLGAHPVYSTVDLSEISLDDTFDLIWVGSLFTHLDQSRWLALLEFLNARLAPEGLLVFTAFGHVDAHGLRGLGMKEHQIEAIAHDWQRAGFSHQEYVGTPGWGLTLSSADFIRDAISGQPGLRMVDHRPGAWLQQDVIACRKG